MDVEEYIKKKVVLTGTGLITKLGLNRELFEALEIKHGKINEVHEIQWSSGGSIWHITQDNEIEGCIIVFQNGTILVIESDDEYIDMFSANETRVRKKKKAKAKP